MQKKILILAAIMASIVLILLLRSEKGVRVDIQAKGDSFFEGLRIVNKKNGATEWVLLANRADLSRDGKEARLNGVEVQLLQQGITVHADSGLYNIDSRQISVDGVIRARSSNYSIVTSQATIDSSTGVLETPGDVRIEGKKFNLEGKGLKADNNEQKVRILKDVKAVFNR